MPVILDIRKDIRYLQGAEDANQECALKMLKEGISFSLIQKITGHTLEQLKKMEEQLKAS
ncbi:hypothetical protein SAMN05421788_107245 [Filimonas lacunae]|uniref:Uncharacterized protein n=1 Tax=Filimonas lacunae TaxID=477680 RepID=A0A173MG58_9BACT|nr:hypothetical protein [Filimonas lacunae]BAV06583.1 hypothetical protein FLA_2602 [Filimonas lacunae]SIT27475.1 hypothetical protein SAMN05421788_107245 [Filimonas lacunae]